MRQFWREKIEVYYRNVSDDTSLQKELFPETVFSFTMLKPLFFFYRYRDLHFFLAQLNFAITAVCKEPFSTDEATFLTCP